MPPDDPEWELFVRETAAESMRHVGSVSAPTTDDARERAAELFGRFAADLWLCPASAVEREREVNPP